MKLSEKLLFGLLLTWLCVVLVPTADKKENKKLLGLPKQVYILIRSEKCQSSSLLRKKERKHTSFTPIYLHIMTLAEQQQSAK